MLSAKPAMLMLFNPEITRDGWASDTGLQYTILCGNTHVATNFDKQLLDDRVCPTHKVRVLEEPSDALRHAATAPRIADAGSNLMAKLAHPHSYPQATSYA